MAHKYICLRLYRGRNRPNRLGVNHLYGTHSQMRKNTNDVSLSFQIAHNSMITILPFSLWTSILDWHWPRASSKILMWLVYVAHLPPPTPNAATQNAQTESIAHRRRTHYFTLNHSIELCCTRASSIANLLFIQFTGDNQNCCVAVYLLWHYVSTCVAWLSRIKSNTN